MRRLVKHIELTAPPPFVPSMLHPPTIAGNVSRLSAECPLCLEVLNSPIELVTCGAIVCSNCCCTWLNLRHELLCPCCYGDHLRDITTVHHVILFWMLSSAFLLYAASAKMRFCFQTMQLTWDLVVHLCLLTALLVKFSAIQSTNLCHLLSLSYKQILSNVHFYQVQQKVW